MDMILEGSELRPKDEGVWHLFVQFTCRLQSQPCWGGSTAFLMMFFFFIIIFKFFPPSFGSVPFALHHPYKKTY